MKSLLETFDRKYSKDNATELESLLTAVENNKSPDENHCETYQTSKKSESLNDLKVKDDKSLEDELDYLDKRYYFKDGLKRIDFVLVWEQEKISIYENETILKKMTEYRKRFEEKLCNTGVEIEKEAEESEKMMIHFVKIHVPFNLLCDYAEQLNFCVPIQINNETEERFTEKLLKKLHLPNIMTNEIPYEPCQYITAEFAKDKMEIYLGVDNEDTFFTTAQRHLIAHEILTTQLYGRQSKAESGIERLISEGVYAAAFPLHEGTSEITPALLDSPENMNRRQILYQYWAKWSKFYKYQPLDNIREYYGENIALYFAWLGQYTAWLFPASVIGIILFVYGVGSMNSYIPSQEICNSNNTYKMCPLCNFKVGCPYWNLSTVCFNAKVTYLFDNPATVLFSIFMSVWAVTFLENWKRKTAELAFKWDVTDIDEKDAPIRTEYAVSATETIKNVYTDLDEPFFSEKEHLKRIVTGFGMILLMICLVIIFLIGVIIYRILIAIPLFENPKLRSQAFIFANISASFINLILILSIGKIYEKVALKLNQWEMHRTENEFKDHLIFKVFLFQFVNYYSSIFYIAFFKGRFTGYPGHYTSFFGLRNEECTNGSCLFELAQQMAIIMVGKEIINDIYEIFVPKVTAWIYRFTKGLNDTVEFSSAGTQPMFWSEDYKLLPHEGLFDEYMEMVLQFGFITIFVAAFPLAPLFALINNWLEIRLDASKLVTDSRRPIPIRAKDIGTWYGILEIIVKISVISNAFLIAFTSDFIPKLIYQFQNNQSLTGYVNFTLAWAPNNSVSQPCRYLAYRDQNGHNTVFHWHMMAIRLAFVVLFEHVVFGIAILINIIIPDIPEELLLEIKKRNYKTKQALLNKGKSVRPKQRKAASISSSKKLRNKA